MGEGIRHLPVGLGAILVLAASSAFASHYESAPEPEPEYPDGLLGTVDETHETISRRVINLSRDIDEFLGTRAYYRDHDYDSILRLSLTYDRNGNGDDLEASVGGNLSLPGTEDRLQLVFVSEDPDDPATRDREDPGREGRRRQEVGLQFLEPFEVVETETSVRVRSGEPIDFRTRIRVWMDFEPGESLLRPRLGIFNSEQTGTGYTADFRFQRFLGRFRFRSDTGATWLRREEQFYYDQTFSLVQPLGRRRDLTWEIGIDGESEPEDEVTMYYGQVRLRSVIHRDWLVAEVRPQWRRDIEEDFSTEFRLYMGIDVLFGHPAGY